MDDVTHLWPPPAAIMKLGEPNSRGLVILESPFAGNVERNTRYARAALKDCLRRGEAPIASHLLYTQPGVLDDAIPSEREAGIAAGLAWASRCDFAVFYLDLGMSSGMQAAWRHYADKGIPVADRYLGTGWEYLR